MASDNNKDEKLPLISDGFSPNFKKDVPKKVLQLLNTAHFNEDELKAAEILKKELVALLSKSYYGQFLSLLSVGDLIENICLWPLIRESAIRDAQNNTSLMNNQPKDGNLSIQTKQEVEADNKPLVQFVDEDSSSKSSQKITSTLLQDDNPILVNTEHFSSNDHIRPRGKSLLLRDPAVLRKVYAMNGTFEGAGFIADRVWKLLLLTILGYDIYQYATDPIYHQITPVKDIILGTSRYGQSLSVILMNPRVWPVVLGLPIVWGIGNGALQVWQMRRWDKDKVDDFVQTFVSYRPHFYRDLLAWLPNTLTFGLLPASQMKRQIAIAEKALLWDGRIDANKHKELFLTLEQCLFHAKKFTLLQLINTLAHLAEGVSERDYPKLAKAGISKEMLTTLLYVKTQAFHRLRQTAKGKIKYKEQFKLISSFLSLYAHYHLWRLGQPQSKLLQPVFWIRQLISYYLYIYFGARIVQNVVDFVNNYIAETNCLNEGKQWLYMEQTANYTCSVCGDWPIYYKNTFDDVSCWNAYLEYPRTSEEILTAIDRLSLINIKIIDLSNQILTEDNLLQILPKIQVKTQSLQTVYLNVRVKFQLFITEIGAKTISDFMILTQTRRLYLNGLIFSSEATRIIAESLNQSAIHTLSFMNCAPQLTGEYCYSVPIQAVSLIELSKQLPHCSVEELILDMNAFNDTEIISLAYALPASSIKNLSLAGVTINKLALSALVEVLPLTKINTLNVINSIQDASATVLLIKILPQCRNLINLKFDCCSTDAELVALGPILNQTNFIQTLNLYLDQITDSGLAALADILPTSQIVNLTLASFGEQFNITQNAFSIFAEALEKSSSIESLVISTNEKVFVDLAPSLKHSNIRSLAFFGQPFKNSRDTIFITLGKILPESAINNLEIYEVFEVTDTGLNALGVGLKSSLIQNFSLVLSLNMHITSSGVTSVIKNLPTKSIQSLSLRLLSYDLGSNYLDLSQTIETLAVLLPYSRIKNLSIMGEDQIVINEQNEQIIINEQSLIYFANSLRSSKISTLGLDFMNGTNAIIALAKNIPSSLLSLDVNIIAADAQSIQSLAKALPSSSLKYFSLRVGTQNIRGDLVAELIAEQLSTAPLSGNDLIEKFNLESQIALATAIPNTNLTYLYLKTANNITTIGAKVLCRVIPQTNIILPGNLWIEGNINPTQVDISTCYISSAHSNSPLWIFSTMYLPYQIGDKYLKWAYETISQTLNFSEPKKIPESVFEKINEDDADEFDTFATEEPFHFDAIYNNDVWSNSMPSFLALSSSSPHQGFVMNYQGWQFSNNNAQYTNFSSTNSIVPASVDPVNGIIAVYMVYKITAPVIKNTFNGVKKLVGSAINFFSSKEESPLSQLDEPKKSSQSWFSFFKHRAENDSAFSHNHMEDTANVSL